MQEHHLTVPRTARYYTLGEPGPAVRQVWIVCHGYGQLAGRFVRHFEPIEDASRLIVAPEGGRGFYINSANNSFRYSDFFLQEFMPEIENRYRIRPGRQSRAITGISMGGYGALRFAFAHPGLFSAASAQSAALITQTPQELSAAGQSNGPLGRLLGSAFGQPINPAHWKQNSIFAVARTNPAGLKKLAIYFNCGKADDFGFEDGATALHQQLQAEGVKHEYHLYPGDHSLTYFLSHMGEVMEFHSRVFAEHR